MQKTIFILISLAVVLGCATSSSAGSPGYWPTEAWRTSTPEAQGMSSAKLADMLAEIGRRGYNIDNLTIVRNGYIVADVYYHPFQKGHKHIIHSCTKSVMSALIGIAIEQGSIKTVDTPVVDFFPDRRPADLDSLKETVTLEHLLMMASGFNCKDSYLYNYVGMRAMRRSPDWIQHVLNLPMRESPGTRFEYCNGVAYLLAAILQESTGQMALAFAREHLFEPLGVTDVVWPYSPQFVNFGWGEMRLTPHDMAKIGYLYLNRGCWQDRQIVPEDWVASSTRQHIDAGTMSEGYGYQWWVDFGGYYMALGYGGQLIFVEPEKQLVVVFTSTLAGRNFYGPEMMFSDYIIPAVLSDRPLPDNPGSTARLASLVAGHATPAPVTIKPLPETAGQVSGREISFEPNDIYFKSYNIFFEPSKAEARFELETHYGSYGGQIGLDNVYRLSETAGETRAYKGYWEDDTTFVISFQVVGYTSKGTARIRFDQTQVNFELTDIVGGTSHQLTGQFVDQAR